MTQLRSPLPWIGGKYYSRERIVSAFPAPKTYNTYVEVFGGAAHILLQKQPHHHLEVYNDTSGDLVNFWMQCRNSPQELQQQIDSLPYARQLYDQWQASLFDGTQMSDMERAVRWFYVLRSSIGGRMRESRGNWAYCVELNGNSIVSKFRSATVLFTLVAERLRMVQIERHDFAHILRTYERPSTLFYCDPPYIGTEYYYTGVPSFTLSDHERLAALLNATPAKVALSYYPHPALDTLYPERRWRRVTWQTYKHAEKTRRKRQTATEMLLCNYPAVQAELWKDEVSA